MDVFNVGDNVVDSFSKKIGVIQGKRERNNNIEWKVRFSQQDVQYIKAEYLEKFIEDDLQGMFETGKFLGINELRRILAFTRIKGDITNIYYSMNNSATEFFPHQFKPVMKFIESTTGRLLIADEVGLGKTIESMYIWEELIARENSRRLLIVCPAVLCEKWKNDLYNYFSIESEIIKVQELLDNIQQAVAQPLKKHFALIISLEGVRYKEKKNKSFDNSPRAKLDDFLEELSSSNKEEVFDLVIIDEAHYLRNSETASFKTASKLRDNAKNLVLLSATPIQTGEENLFNLLRILSPEEFYDQYAFYRLLSESQNFIRIANLLRSNAPLEKYEELISEIREGYFYKDDSFINEFEEKLPSIIDNREICIEYYNKFLKKVFYSSYLTRTRKRDAFEKRPTRDAYTITYHLTDYEQYLYNSVTKSLEEASEYANSFCQFQIIARQRQMASCMPAAFIDWKSKKDNDDYSTNIEEQLLDDLGFYSDGDDEENDDFDVAKTISNINIDIKRLMDVDSKYLAVKNAIQKKLKDKPNTKIIIFSFYRGTIKYLAQKFSDDNISCISMMGGVGINKHEVVKNFRDNPSINILLSTEVGSEGIDMQFCDTEFNYDLPWNPMRLEQRIGRIDRIGQKSDILHIFNMICSDSVEDKVLDRLYNRINIFKNSIGDIEEILGNEIQNLALDLLNRDLTEEEKLKKADEKIDTIIMKKNQLEDLENSASSSIAYKDYLIQNVEEAKKTERFIHSTDLMFYVRDYLESMWPGSKFIDFPSINKAALISLSPEAAQNYSEFLKKEGLNSTLKYGTSEFLCLFDSTQREKVKRNNYEVISYSNPLIKWITEEKSKYPTASYGCSSVTMHDEEERLPKGIYSYSLQEWIAEGYKDKKEVKYYLCNIETKEVLPPLLSEEIIMKVVAFGESNPSWKNDAENISSKSCDAMTQIFDVSGSDFENFETSFLQENEEMCKQQKDYLKLMTDRKIESLRKTILEMQSSDSSKQKGIKLRESKIKKAQENYEMQIRNIDNKVKARCSYNDIGMGIIKVY
ncbi:SNF2-related protein [uncultured Treponema sp.]|uniref:DEAD/DEAH box helicase n=1 Tax=uncultured Treponema sp. TaxID=162155 RepID=UPI0025D72EE5|nr:SNF2-related protein [uncultured Treponema sp.]